MTIVVERVEWARAREQLLAVRVAVFEVEQGISSTVDLDGRDATAVHVLATFDGEAAGTGRLLPDGTIGRMAVLSEHRRRGIGTALMHALLDAANDAGHQVVRLHAQIQVEDFYLALGFTPAGAHHMEVGIEHVPMTLVVDGPRR